MNINTQQQTEETDIPLMVREDSNEEEVPVLAASGDDHESLGTEDERTEDRGEDTSIQRSTEDSEDEPIAARGQDTYARRPTSRRQIKEPAWMTSG